MLTIFAILCVLVGNGIDYYTTMRALRRGAHDANPFVHVMDFATWKFMTTIVTLGFVFGMSEHFAVWFGVIVLVLFSGVGIWNINHTPKA